MMTQHEMTDAEVTDQISRADAFRESLRAAVDEAISNLDPHSTCVGEARAGLKRIADSLDAVPLVTFANFSNIDAALRKRTSSSLIEVVALHLRAVGGGPSLDFENAVTFLKLFEPLIDLAKRRRDQLIGDTRCHG